MPSAIERADQLRGFTCQKVKNVAFYTIANNIPMSDYYLGIVYNHAQTRFEVECSHPKFLFSFLKNPHFVLVKLHINRSEKVQIIEGYFDPTIQNVAFF